MISHVPCPKEQPRPASGSQCQPTAEKSTESTICKGGKIKLINYKIIWTTGEKYGKLSIRISAMRGKIFLNAICKKKKDNY